MYIKIYYGQGAGGVFWKLLIPAFQHQGDSVPKRQRVGGKCDKPHDSISHSGVDASLYCSRVCGNQIVSISEN